MSVPSSSLVSAPGPWRPPRLVKASVACHVGAAVVVGVAPAAWPWAAGALVANHALLSVTGLWPRSTWLGENLRRLPAGSEARREIAITIDDGPDPAVTPGVLDLLDAHAARATFFCIARRALDAPALCREIVRRGHAVENHSFRHRHDFSLLGPRGYAREIGRAQDAIADVTGRRPRFFRAPAGLRNPFLDAVLQRQGLTLVSWTRRGFDTRRRDADRVVATLADGLAARDILLLHDGHAAQGPTGRPVVLDVLPRLLDRVRQAALRAVTLDDAVARP